MTCPVQTFIFLDAPVLIQDAPPDVIFFFLITVKPSVE